eukprot:32664-Chlamydomonas_euryale.AAC.2
MVTEQRLKLATSPALNAQARYCRQHFGPARTQRQKPSTPAPPPHMHACIAPQTHAPSPPAAARPHSNRAAGGTAG